MPLPGSGGIKPNISNFGADQFDSRSFLVIVQQQKAAWTKGVAGGCRIMYCMKNSSWVVHHPDIQKLIQNNYTHKTWQKITQDTRQQMYECCKDNIESPTWRVHDPWVHELKASKAAKHGRSFTRILAGRKEVITYIMQSSLVQLCLIPFTFYGRALFESAAGWIWISLSRHQVFLHVH